MRFKPTSTAATLLLVATLGACGSIASDPSAPGAEGPEDARAGAEGSAAAPDAPVAPLCVSDAAGPTTPASFGKLCGAGSNKALCVMDGSTACEGGVCLWDQNGVKDRAYCTVACDPADAQVCPKHFACTAQQCSGTPSHICVRVEKDSEDSCSAISPTRSYRDNFVLQAPGARLYSVGVLSDPSALGVFTLGPGESKWTLIHEDPNTTVGKGYHLGLPDGSVLFDRGLGKVWRLEGTKVIEERYETCDGTCETQLTGLWRTPQGTIRALGQTKGPLLERSDGGTWSVVKQELPRRAVPLATLEDHGLLAMCQPDGAPAGSPFTAPCWGETGDDFELFSLPEGEPARIPALTGRAVQTALGKDRSDFYIFTDDGTLYRRFEGAFHAQPLPKGKWSSFGLSRLSDGTLWAKVGPENYLLTGGCWQKSSDSSFGFSVSGKSIAYPSDETFCTTTLE